MVTEYEQKLLERIEETKKGIKRYEKHYKKWEMNEDYMEFKKINYIPNCHCGTSILKSVLFNLEWVLKLYRECKE